MGVHSLKHASQVNSLESGQCVKSLRGAIQDLVLRVINMIMNKVFNGKMIYSVCLGFRIVFF